MKNVHILSFSGPYFPAFGLRTRNYSANLRIQVERGKIETIKTLNTDNFYAVLVNDIHCPVHVKIFQISINPLSQD